jgi:nuclear pore complex protein Nup155
MQLAIQRDARPLPQFIIDRLGTVEIGTRSGLFAEIHRAWITCDDEVFLWNYEDPTEEDVA